METALTKTLKSCGVQKCLNPCNLGEKAGDVYYHSPKISEKA